MCNISPVPKPPSKIKMRITYSRGVWELNTQVRSRQINYLSSPIYSYFSIAVSFFKAILHKLYNPIVTVFKDQFLQWAGVNYY